MGLKQFIKENREEIDRHIRLILGDKFTLNDNERGLWILNDEGLYNWARQNKVKI